MTSLVSKLKAPLPFIKGGRASARLCTVWKDSGRCGLARCCIHRGVGSPLRARALRVLGVFPALPFFDVAQVPGPEERSLGLGSAGPGRVGRRGVCGVLREPFLQPPSHLQGRSGLCWGLSTHGPPVSGDAALYRTLAALARALGQYLLVFSRLPSHLHLPPEKERDTVKFVVMTLEVSRSSGTGAQSGRKSEGAAHGGRRPLPLNPSAVLACRLRPVLSAVTLSRGMPIPALLSAVRPPVAPLCSMPREVGSSPPRLCFWVVGVRGEWALSQT